MARAKPSKSTGMGTKIETLWYDVEQLVGEDATGDEGEGRDLRKVVNRKVSIDLYMVKKFNTMEERPAPAETIDLAFTLHCPELDIKVHGSDVSVMLKDMRGQLDHRFKIKWVNYYIVRVSPARNYDGGIGSGLTFSYDTIERGVALDGSVLMRRVNRWGDLHSNLFVIEPWPKDVRENGKLVATIIATDETLARLENMQEKIHMLRKAIAAMVTPDRLEETLMMASRDEFLALGSGRTD
ncbi:hypothetical protein G6L37_00745 [Agrobacterium rubi]|nr:hypothetical protein [Agrobacterium rubi]NTF23918.1 hypothetical protein [Agrobacterium rubi]